MRVPGWFRLMLPIITALLSIAWMTVQLLYARLGCWGGGSARPDVQRLAHGEDAGIAPGHDRDIPAKEGIGYFGLRLSVLCFADVPRSSCLTSKNSNEEAVTTNDAQLWWLRAGSLSFQPYGTHCDVSRFLRCG